CSRPGWSRADMRITAITARTVRWPIASQGAARGRTERAAVIVEVRSAGGAVGLGEAAPLPGMSLDTLDEANRSIAGFARTAPFDVELPPPGRRPVNVEAPRARGPGLRNPAIDPRPILAIADRDAMHAFLVAPPAARFAIETAVLDAIGRERGRSIAALFGGSDEPLALAAVVDDAEQARRAFADGIRCLKIKLAADDDPGRVFAIAAAVPQARLRIDANRSWPRAEVADRLAALAALPIDYVEEPCRDSHQLLSESLPCPIALDEGLLAMSEVEICVALRSIPRLAAVVLKPTLLGGFSVVFPIAALAQSCRVPPIVSHALEGPIGSAACAEIARAIGGRHAVGLAAHAALAGWAIAVPQLAADHIHAAARPGLGFASDLDWP
ncbi:MAG TPA: enolase C-terminal domain-like protein, partial [Kofleriaceae bacterium]